MEPNKDKEKTWVTGICCWLVVLIVGLSYITIGCDESIESSCPYFYIELGNTTKYTINAVSDDSYYIDEIIKYRNGVCSMRHPIPYYWRDDAVIAGEKLLGHKDIYYIVKSNTNTCYSKDVAEYNFNVGLWILTIAAIPCFICCVALCAYFVEKCVSRNNQPQPDKNLKVYLEAADEDFFTLPTGKTISQAIDYILTRGLEDSNITNRSCAIYYADMRKIHTDKYVWIKINTESCGHNLLVSSSGNCQIKPSAPPVEQTVVAYAIIDKTKWDSFY